MEMVYWEGSGEETKVEFVDINKEVSEYKNTSCPFCELFSNNSERVIRQIDFAFVITSVRKNYRINSIGYHHC